MPARINMTFRSLLEDGNESNLRLPIRRRFLKWLS
jgi:hypothetical protein